MSKIIKFFFKLTVYEKHLKDIPNISILQFTRGFDDNDVNKIRTVYFRHLFTPIIYLLNDCEGGMKFYSPREHYGSRGQRPKENMIFLRGINLHVSRRFMQ